MRKKVKYYVRQNGIGHEKLLCDNTILSQLAYNKTKVPEPQTMIMMSAATHILNSDLTRFT